MIAFIKKVFWSSIAYRQIYWRLKHLIDPDWAKVYFDDRNLDDGRNRHKLIEFINKLNQNKILEIGCSSGANLFLLEEKKKYEIQKSVFGFEIYLDQISQFNSNKSSTKKAYEDNSLQAIERDFAFLFSRNIKGADIIQTVKKIDLKRIKEVIIFDVFESEKLTENIKSIAFKVILQPIESTFTDKEIEKISKSIINHISTNFDGQLRQ